MAFMDIPKAAKILQLSEEQLRRRLRAGTVAGRKVGDHWHLDAPPIFDLYRSRGGLMPIPGDLVRVSIPDAYRDYSFKNEPRLKDVASWSGLLAEVQDWIHIESPTDIGMNVTVANTVTGSHRQGGISFAARLVLHESGELRQAWNVYDRHTGKFELIVWGDQIGHYKCSPRKGGE